ncbi:MAG: AbrB/MazE/SpoVT family DNA-binding domain-containing protein [Nitrospinales bacterium]
MFTKATKIGKRGTLVIPAALRKQFRLEEGAEVLVEETEDGVLIRPACTLPVEVYTPERIATFLLSNAVDKEDYAAAAKEVRKMGLDPDKIRHYNCTKT